MLLRNDKQTGAQKMAANNQQLFTSDNAKTPKGEKHKIKTFVLYLASGDKSVQAFGKKGGLDVCPNRSKACFEYCIDNQGRGNFDAVKLARLRKTKQYKLNPAKFKGECSAEIGRKIRWWANNRPDWKLAIRADGTSDLGIGRAICDQHPEAAFYDYTKNIGVIRKHARGHYSDNYHITYSWSGENKLNCLEALLRGYNVAVPFRHLLAGPHQPKKLRWHPDEFLSFPVVSGENDDLRFLDPSPVVVALSPKGRAIHDDSGFVVRGIW